MRNDQRGYVVHVEFGDNLAAVICLTFYLEPSKKHVGVEFFEVVTTSDEKFGIPSDRTATFKAELRTLHQAAGIVHQAAGTASARKMETLYIEQKLHEAYGAAAKIHIKRIEKKAT